MVIKKNEMLLQLTAFYLHLSVFRGILQNISIIVRGEEWVFLRPLFALLGCAVIIVAGLCTIKMKMIDKRVVYIFCCWILLFVFSYILNPSLERIILKVIFYSTQVFVIMLLFSQISNLEELESKLRGYIFVTTIYSILQFFAFIMIGGYSMEYSYNTMISVLLSLCLGINHKKKKYLYLFLYFVFVNLICGSRGSIICYCIAVLLLLYFKNKEKIFVISLPIIIGCLVSYNSLCSLLLALFPTSRTIELFASGKILNLSGRDEYYEYIINMILNDSWRVHGIYSDRLFLSKYFHSSLSTEIYGSYAHNFFLEILFQFGFIGVPILFICIFILFYSVFWTKRQEPSALQDLFIISFAFCVGQLMFSGSYLTANSFGIFVGVLLMFSSGKWRKNEKGIDSF